MKKKLTRTYGAKKSVFSSVAAAIFGSTDESLTSIPEKLDVVEEIGVGIERLDLDEESSGVSIKGMFHSNY
jgi:hypothetical protein